MRAFAWFLGTLVAAGLIAAVIAYPVYELTSQVASWPFHRVASRVAMLAAAGGLAWVCRHLGVGGRRALGYGLPWRRFVKVALSCGVIGMATAAVGAALLLAMHWRVVADAPSVSKLFFVFKLFLVGLSSGIAVALIEETVMRGALHSAIARESGQWAAVLLTAPLFAVLHFFAKARIPVDQLNWGSGFDLLARSFAPLGTPSLVFDSFMAWLAVSLVLSLTRVLTGNIAAALGLHAGWVVILRMLQEATASGPAAEGSAWLGRFDGLLGYWVLPWSAAIGLALWLTRHAWVPYAAGLDCGAPGGAPDDGVKGAMAASPSRRSTGSSSSK
jgi:membrane protease YdiL (CAAX protease family)